jgi:DNA repair protein RecO (recombination protein O)
MEWKSDAIVLGRRRHGDANAICDLLTPDYGRVRGLVRGGYSKRESSTLQTGNCVKATWRARLESHLGTLQIEPFVLYAARFYDNRIALLIIQTAANLSKLLYEKEPHPRLYNGFLELLSPHLHDLERLALLIRWEALLLEELGFGLDLRHCALTGTSENLAYVSPRAFPYQIGSIW